MKILYVGTERAEAQAIATAVNSLGERVRVSWTSGLDRVAHWIDENDGLRVLVVEAQPNGPVWRSVLTYAAGLPTALPVVVIVPQEFAPDLQPIALDAHECVARNPSLLQDLPAVITRAIDQARHRQLERATRDMVHEQFREAAIEVERVRLRHASAVADVERLALREAELSVQLDSATRTRGVLERRLADAETALHAGEARAAEERRSVAERVAERQREFERKISEEIDKRRGVEDTLAHTMSAGTASERRHESAMTAAAVQSRELQAALSAARQELESKAARLDALATSEAELTALLESNARATRELMAAGKQAAEREAELEEQIRQERAARAAVEEEITDAGAALGEARRENQCAAADVARLIERGASLASELTDAHAALRDEQQRHDVALATAAGELDERQAHFDRERTQAEEDRGGLTAQLREVEEARDQSRREHESAVADVTRLTEHAAAEREAAAACHADLEARMNALRAAALVQAAQFDEQRREYECRLAEAESVNSTLARERVALQQSLHATQEESHEIERRFEEARSALQDSLKARVEELEGLQQELHQSRADNHRLFQQAPLPMFRCTKDGVLTQANRMLTILLGRRSAEELRGADLAAATFESPNDLSWLIERCLGSRGKESTETTWRRKDGSRLLVRLSACATSSDLIECGVEDLTPIRVLHDRLSQAHRMEAVGRLATEVAVTCGSLLSGVHQNAQQWLMTDGGHPASRHHGEMLLEEISRAAGLLRQLAAYGDEESRRPAVVELRTVVRDVAPVLKRVAGDAVEVQLPAASAPLNVDAGAERVKRLLVNLAAYGRERMPFGGRLKIELGTIVVDRHFAAKHPNVRLGPHALVTVTESRRARTDGSPQLHDNEAGSSSRNVAVRTGVDLGTLQELVAECGGHLWMTVEPVGDMVVKIRLPLVTSYGEPPRRTLTIGGRVRTIGHWFHH